MRRGTILLLRSVVVSTGAVRIRLPTVRLRARFNIATDNSAFSCLQEKTKLTVKFARSVIALMSFMGAARKTLRLTFSQAISHQVNLLLLERCAPYNFNKEF